jgi:cytochrome c2
MTKHIAVIVTMLLATGCGQRAHVDTIAGGDVERGRVVLEQFDCGACHEIPGVPGTQSRVGPPLAGFGKRAYVAGRFENSPEVVVRWLRDPPAMKPTTAMPALGLTEAQARDAMAYLYSLE